MNTLPYLIHKLPGRVRIRVHRLSHDPIFALHLQQLLKATDGIKNLRLNAWAASIVIYYHPKKAT